MCLFWVCFDIMVQVLKVFRQSIMLNSNENMYFARKIHRYLLIQNDWFSESPTDLIGIPIEHVECFVFFPLAMHVPAAIDFFCFDLLSL